MAHSGGASSHLPRADSSRIFMWRLRLTDYLIVAIKAFRNQLADAANSPSH